MYAAQFIAILVLAYLLFRVYRDYSAGRIDWQGVLSWGLVIGVFIIIALFPLRISTEIKDLLGLGRGLDALFVVSIGLLFLLLFELYAKIDRVEREITELTRKVGIELEEINERLEKIEKE
ncbi:DUF2304 domain-containing protein [Thermococcus gorgonarius]|uniref:UDP-N-acetylglucosamine--dolichyl-phosphate N-acetylglucosaminephosphotransferase n=1 Tax=Thermococcus gorgonarius TaxID=71997 RepID=A0A2Z2M998_THEGO|nr:DUF2304 family protein [Thermococcus gorgonarius]ASJ01075.1 UDP-N-acetylglucosamine--dolichyl-phosphate N-acetylglucosaminephosphotransferase [Thermococcus gorgonarius]